MVCLAAKPAVDGFEREYEGRARVLRADLQSDAGGRLAERYAIDTVPSFLVFDADGDVVDRFEGTSGAPVAELRRALREAGVGARRATRPRT